MESRTFCAQISSMLGANDLEAIVTVIIACSISLPLQYPHPSTSKLSAQECYKFPPHSCASQTALAPAAATVLTECSCD